MAVGSIAARTNVPAATSETTTTPADSGGKETGTGISATTGWVLGGVAAGAIGLGAAIGKMNHHPLIGAGVGAAVAATIAGAALLGGAGSSQYDGWCDYSNFYSDPDCDYPRTYDPPYYDPYIPRDDYPYSGGYGGYTGPGDEY